MAIAGLPFGSPAMVVLRRLTQFSNVRLSSSENTSGSSLLSPTPPQAVSEPGDIPEHGTGTQNESRGDREIKPAH